jgi:hypothetical protein
MGRERMELMRNRKKCGLEHCRRSGGEAGKRHGMIIGFSEAKQDSKAMLSVLV